jgi:hypothetical protein
VTEPTIHTLDVPGAPLTYDVLEAQTTVGHRPLLIVGSPDGASGFAQLVPHFTDRKVFTYDPRGMERWIRAGDGQIHPPTAVRDRSGGSDDAADRAPSPCRTKGSRSRCPERDDVDIDAQEVSERLLVMDHIQQ